jgi:hypothetical protein
VGGEEERHLQELEKNTDSRYSALQRAMRTAPRQEHRRHCASMRGRA